MRRYQHGAGCCSGVSPVHADHCPISMLFTLFGWPAIEKSSVKEHVHGALVCILQAAPGTVGQSAGKQQADQGLCQPWKRHVGIELSGLMVVIRRTTSAWSIKTLMSRDLDCESV